jgi:hypothetical protein
VSEAAESSSEFIDVWEPNGFGILLNGELRELRELKGSGDGGSVGGGGGGGGGGEGSCWMPLRVRSEVGEGWD